MITTLHNTHANFVIKSLSKNKHVYVEKPLALNIDELKEINSTYKKNDGSLIVGFNKFSLLTEKVLSLFKGIEKK